MEKNKKEYIHKELVASGRWYKMSLAEQMGNIGAEVIRMVNRRKKEDRVSEKSCFVRVLELIDLTISDKRWRNRLFEICRLREVICDLFFGGNTYKISPKFLKDYFLFFALIIK